MKIEPPRERTIVRAGLGVCLVLAGAIAFELFTKDAPQQYALDQLHAGTVALSGRDRRRAAGDMDVQLVPDAQPRALALVIGLESHLGPDGRRLARRARRRERRRHDRRRRRRWR